MLPAGAAGLLHTWMPPLMASSQWNFANGITSALTLASPPEPTAAYSRAWLTCRQAHPSVQVSAGLAA